MAVARVFGRADGAEVVMEQTQGDIWSVPVPLDQDGEYVVEIIAEDGAGNQSYMAKMLFCVDSSGLCVQVLPALYSAELLEPCCQSGGGVNMQKIIFDIGEHRHVRLKIHAAQDAPFRIKSASWELLRGNTLEASGECEIDEHIIDAYIEAPPGKTSYILRVIYKINDETLVEQLDLVVV